MSKKYAAIRVTRIDAATRQFRTAIGLYFQEGDPVAIHTLTMATRQILRVLSKHGGKGAMLMGEEMMLEPHQRTKAGLKRHHEEVMKEANFKHSSSDPNEALIFFKSLREVPSQWSRQSKKRVCRGVLKWGTLEYEALDLASS